ALVAPALWYSLGPAAGLYSLAVRLPGFASVRGPGHAMFVVTLGLSVAAAAFVARLRWRGLAVALCLLASAELFLWNFQRTRMVYARGSYQESQVRSHRWLSEMARLPLPVGSRLAAPERWAGVEFGPAQFHLETTFGSNALMPARYFDYLNASTRNYALLGGLGVSRYFDPHDWKVHDLPGWLPRLYSPAAVETVPDEAAARRRLETLDPAATVMVEGSAGATHPNGQATVTMREFSEQRYRAEIEARGETLLRFAVPWFPGWHATLDGREALIERVDHALMGVRIPAGTHQLVLAYRQNYLLTGASLSLAAGCLLLAFVIRPLRR
ncbi:MAG: YfhO family protein, partial [Acidobacteria bacterium]|nr:YfhO family protein [Acidobacteriota bacterium]